MKKSIFKRIVSAALALTMLASMAVGMSTSASAATNAKPGAIGKMWFEKCANSNYVKLRWTPAANATRYIVSVVDAKSINDDKFAQYRTYECNSSSTWQNLYATKKDLLSSRYFIYVTSYNDAGAGPTARPYEFQGYEDWYRPYLYLNVYLMSEDYKKTGKESIILSKNSAKVTANVNAKVTLYYDLLLPTKKNENAGLIYRSKVNQGFRIAFKDFGSEKNKCAVTACATPETYRGFKSCTVRGLEPGNTYAIWCTPFVYDYKHTCIYGEDEYLYEWITIPY